MKNLLRIATECIDQFAEQKNATRLAAIVGGEAVIMHGIPRTTLDLDILFFCLAEENNTDSLVKQLAFFLREKLDILVANYRWEIDGLKETASPFGCPLPILPKPYLVGMKLMAGGVQDEEDIRNLFL